MPGTQRSPFAKLDRTSSGALRTNRLSSTTQLATGRSAPRRAPSRGIGPACHRLRRPSAGAPCPAIHGDRGVGIFARHDDVQGDGQASSRDRNGRRRFQHGSESAARQRRNGAQGCGRTTVRAHNGARSGEPGKGARSENGQPNVLPYVALHETVRKAAGREERGAGGSRTHEWRFCKPLP